VNARGIACGERLPRRFVDRFRLGVVIARAQTTLSLEPILVGTAKRATPLFPQSVSEFALLLNID
jgi:hypothetical protein